MEANLLQPPGNITPNNNNNNTTTVQSNTTNSSSSSVSQSSSPSTTKNTQVVPGKPTAIPVGNIVLTAKDGEIHITQSGIKPPSNFDQVDEADKDIIINVLKATVDLHKDSADEPTEYSLTIIRKTRPEGSSPLVLMPIVCYVIVAYGYLQGISAEDLLLLREVHPNIKKVDVQLRITGEDVNNSVGGIVVELSSTINEKTKRSLEAADALLNSKQHQQQQQQQQNGNNQSTSPTTNGYSFTSNAQNRSNYFNEVSYNHPLSSTNNERTKKRKLFDFIPQFFWKSKDN